MQGQEILTSMIEVGIGIAGFSSIVVTLARNSIGESVKITFLQIWIQSAAIILFSSIPLVLATTDIKPQSIYVVVELCQ